MTGHHRTAIVVVLLPILTTTKSLAQDAVLHDGFLGPLPYLDFDDPAAGEAVSPFAQLRFEYFHLEDFEDEALNVPGAFIEEVANGRPLQFGTRLTLGSDRAVDSVDGDDGLIDGQGNFVSLWSNRITNTITFVFSPDVLGQLPTHAGIVWTDVAADQQGLPTAADLRNNVVFQAYGADGQSLGIIGPFSLGDETLFGTTDEDRFFGIVNSDGVSRIRISMPMNKNWEVDHLQYGRGLSNEIPEASAAWLLAIGFALLIGLVVRERRRYAF